MTLICRFYQMWGKTAFTNNRSRDHH